MSQKFEPFKTNGIYKMRHGNVWATFLMSDQLFYSMEHSALDQIRNSMSLPGVESLTITPDAHTGYGFAIGSVVASETHIYPDVVGPDPACSVALSRIEGFTLEGEKEKRALLNEIQKVVKVGNDSNGHRLTMEEFRYIVNGEMRPYKTWVRNSEALWTQRGKDEHKELMRLFNTYMNERMLSQLGTIGGGNHMWELQEDENGTIHLMTHFGSRGIGATLANYFDKAINEELKKWGVEIPSKGLLYIPADSFLGKVYYMFQVAMLEWATYNHYYIHEVTWDVINKLHPGITAEFEGHIPHNFIEYRNGKYVGRKGATPAYEFDGIPLLVPGSMSTASYVLRPGENAAKLGESVSHGAGRVLSRGKAKELLPQDESNIKFASAGVIGNFDNVPLDESQDAYKDVDEVVNSLVDVGAATVERKLRPIMVLKG